MVLCNQYFSAQDGEGNNLPFTVYFDILKRVDSEWIPGGSASIASGALVMLLMDDGVRYKVTPRDQSGWTTPNAKEFVACGNDVVFVYIKPCPSPSIASIHCDDNTPKTGQNVSFWRDGEFGGSGQYIVSRLWEFGDGGTATTSAATHTYDTVGTYTVKFTIINDCGKSAYKTMVVTVSTELPDITLTDWTLPTTCSTGSTITPSVDVKNNSLTDPASIKVIVNGTNTVTGYSLSSGFVEGVIPIGGSLEISCPIDVPIDADFGTYSLMATVYSMGGVLLAIGTAKTINIDIPPVITSISTKDPPKLCEPIQFLNMIEWNDDGGTGLRKTIGWQYTTSSEEWVSECADELDWTQFSTDDWPEHTFTEAEADIAHIRCIVENRYGKRACAIIQNFTFEDADGFVISIGADLVGKELFVGKVYQIPLTDTWFYLAAYGFIETVGSHAQWASLAEGTYYKVKVGVDACTLTPTPDKIIHFQFGDVSACFGVFSDGDHVAIMAGDIGTNFINSEDVYQISGSSVKCVHKTTASIDPVYDLFGKSVCDFFVVSETDCPLFLAEMCSDPVFVSNQLGIIIDHVDMYGEHHPPEWYDYPLLGLGIFGMAVPAISFGGIGKAVGRKITGLIDQVKRIPADFTEARHGNFMVGFLKGDGERISAMVDAYKAQDWVNFDKAYYDIIANPIALIDQLKRARRWLDEIYKHGYGKSSVDDIALRPLEAQMGLIVDYLATPLRYRFIKPDNLEIIEELFEAGLRNAARREILTSAESAAILQMVYNNPECFVKAIGNLPSGEYSALLSVLGKSGAITEKKLVEEAMTILSRPDLFPKMSYLSAIIAHHPLAILIGSSDEIAEAFIREFPTLTGERCLAEMSLLTPHFKTHYPGVVDAAVENLKITKGWSAFHARKVIEEGELGWVIKERIKSVPSYAIAHPILVVEGIIAWYMGGIAPMWFIEEVPQGYSIQIYTFIKREEYDLARDQLTQFKNILEAIENDIMPTAKFLFPMWAIYMDTAMQNHWDQYHGYAKLLGVETAPMPEINESVAIYVDEIKNANTFYTGIDPAETWREDIGGWLTHKGSDPQNIDPEVPILYQATFTEVFVAQGEHYEPQLVKRKELGKEETRWSVGSGEDKILHNAIIEWQNINIKGKKLTLLSDVDCQWDGERRIKACVKSGTVDLNKNLIIKGYAAIWFLGCPEGTTTKNKQINYTDYASKETTAKETMLGIWAEAAKTGTIKCTSNQVGFSVYIDEVYFDHSYGNTYLVVEDVPIGDRVVKIEKGTNYTPEFCEETVVVTEGAPTTIDCQMIETGACSPVSSVIISLTPKNPLKDETVAFTGYATSEDPIETWEWDFGDGSPKVTGQAVTHTYRKIGIFKTTLTVTNDCGEFDSVERMVTVTEFPTEESGTLLVKEPIDSVTQEKCKGSWTAEIYVDGNTIGKTTQFSIPFGTNEYIGGHGGQCGDHVIKVVLSGYDDAVKSVTINDGDSKSWQPIMTLHGTAVGIMKLTSNQTGFAGYVDGKFIGNSGTNDYLNVPNIAVGSRTVKIVKGEGYTPESCEGTVTVTDGGTVTYDCQMTKVTLPEHTVSIEVPVGSTLWVDGNVA